MFQFLAGQNQAEGSCKSHTHGECNKDAYRDPEHQNQHSENLDHPILAVHDEQGRMSGLFAYLEDRLSLAEVFVYLGRIFHFGIGKSRFRIKLLNHLGVSEE